MKRLKTDDAVRMYGDSRCESFFSITPKSSIADVMKEIEKARKSNRDCLFVVLKR